MVEVSGWLASSCPLSFGQGNIRQTPLKLWRKGIRIYNFIFESYNRGGLTYFDSSVSNSSVVFVNIFAAAQEL